MTNRVLHTQAELDAIDFGKSDGLVPIVVQNAETGRVLMLGFANLEAAQKTLETRQVHFWSRSRQELWRKGEISGNTLSLISLHADCDGDALLARVEPAGPTCHTGETSCFGDETEVLAGYFASLDTTLAARAEERPEGSYTVRLLDDKNLRLKKLGEETAELVASLATGDRPRMVAEAADLVYHLLVALRAEEISAADLLRELADRA
mgnify:FL=1|jgi:phosphoribosyl-ATP pyrophosphohydrolase/phosphoribosyl-AMP cyclohydrolase